MTTSELLLIFQIILIIVYAIFSCVMIRAIFQNTLAQESKFLPIVAFISLWIIMSLLTHHILTLSLSQETPINPLPTQDIPSV